MNLKNVKDELFKVWDTKNKCFLKIGIMMKVLFL